MTPLLQFKRHADLASLNYEAGFMVFGDVHRARAVNVMELYPEYYNEMMALAVNFRWALYDVKRRETA